MRERADRREGVAGVRNQQASFANGTVTNRDTFYEPGSTHFYQRQPPTPTPPTKTPQTINQSPKTHLKLHNKKHVYPEFSSSINSEITCKESQTHQKQNTSQKEKT